MYNYNPGMMQPLQNQISNMMNQYQQATQQTAPAVQYVNGIESARAYDFAEHVEQDQKTDYVTKEEFEEFKKTLKETET